MNKILTRTGPTITFGGDGTGPNPVAMTLAGLVNAAGRISAQFDLSTLFSGARPTLFSWSARIKLAAAATVNNVAELYLSSADSLMQDGTLGALDTALSNIECRRNLQRVGVIEVDNATGTPYFQASGIVQIWRPKISLVVWNGTGQTFSAVAADCVLTMTAMWDEVGNPEV